MAPWSTHTEGRNWRFIILMIYMTFVAFGCAYGINKAIDANDANTALISQIVAVGKEADYKLCVSVKAGKQDRIKEYQFTIAQTLRFYKANPTVPKSNLKITLDFYHALIKRTRDTIVNCPPPPEGQGASNGTNSSS